MTETLKRSLTFTRIRNALCVALLIAAGVAILGPIGSSRAITQDRSDPRQDYAGSRVYFSTDGTTFTTTACPFRCSEGLAFLESFDNVAPPALPAGWLATKALGPPPLWVTSNSGLPNPPADTPPNAAFIDDPAVVSDKRLDSLQLHSNSVAVTFHQNFNLEASEVDPNVGFDGGALEMSRRWKHISRHSCRKGSFVIGGYNRTIAADRDSPIAGRQAWSGNSQGFITTVVNLPFSPGNARLRWRMASDNTGSSEGWRVDTVTIFACEPTPCPPPTPRPRITPAPRPVSSAPPSPHATPAFTPAPR